MISFITKLFEWLSGGVLSRVLDTVDKKIQLQGDREKLKTDIILEHYRSRSDYMKAGGLWLMLLFAVPLGIWFASVCIYSMLFCAGCAFPQTWTIAALPAPLDEWAGLIVISIFGVVGVSNFRK